MIKAPLVIWFMGLSAAGKTTLAEGMELRLKAEKLPTYLLDGDRLRQGLSKDLGFSPEDRKENIRRAGEVASILVDAGHVVLASFITPYEADRAALRSRFQVGGFIEVYVKCSLKECQRRDPKGIYKKVKDGNLSQMTGIDAPFEIPLNGELIIDTEELNIEQSLDKIMSYLRSR